MGCFMGLEQLSQALLNASRDPAQVGECGAAASLRSARLRTFFLMSLGLDEHSF